MSQNTLFRLSKITTRFGQKVIFKDLDFTVNKGECWALTGNSGAGKSALLEAIAGNFNVLKGHVERPFYDNFIKANHPSDHYFNYRHLISYLPMRYQFKNLSNTLEFFYQQRYNAAFSEDAPTVAAYLNEKEEKSLVKGSWTAKSVVDLFQLEPLVQKQLIKLSNGETKRLRLAACLLKNPRLLLLDSPLVGLDVPTRANFNSILEKIGLSGASIILTSTANEIPAFVSHVAILDKCKIIKTSRAAEFDPADVPTPVYPSINKEKIRSLTQTTAHSQWDFIIKMNKVSVKYGDNTILQDIDWEVKPGERWALQGPNGAGKSTLLSLINGDNPQAYASDIFLFDKHKGTGESIWEIKKKIGFVSPELLHYFHSRANCWEIVASGFKDTIGYLSPVDEQQKQVVDKWLDILELRAESEQVFETASPTTQRLVLLARAMVKNPPLLILDEPCQGLDRMQQKRVQSVIDAVCSASSTALIYVTHYEEELPTCISQVLQLDAGRRV